MEEKKKNRMWKRKRKTECGREKEKQNVEEKERDHFVALCSFLDSKSHDSLFDLEQSMGNIFTVIATASLLLSFPSFFSFLQERERKKERVGKRERKKERERGNTPLVDRQNTFLMMVCFWMRPKINKMI